MNFIPDKKLGFGLMRLPQNSEDAADIDLEQVKQMVDLFLEKGFTYFDTAWMYNGFASENAVKEVLTSRHPRESFTLATKLHAGFIRSLRTAIRSSTRSSKRPAPDILIIIFSTASRPGCSRPMRNSTVFHGCLIRKPKGW